MIIKLSINFHECGRPCQILTIETNNLDELIEEIHKLPETFAILKDIGDPNFLGMSIKRRAKMS